MSLAALFPEGDYRFHLSLRRGEPPEFYRRHDPGGRLLAERTRWLDAEPARYAALQPEGEPLFEEAAALCAEWAGLEARPETMHALGGQIEPDIVLLAPDREGRFRLRGGALCFPTGWGLDEKLGGTLDATHGVVPGLNSALGAQIHQFLSKLKPGVAFHRDNWGIAATDELNLHPSRAIAPPVAPARLDQLWLRVEHQTLVALPRSGGVLFGIRIALHRLDEITDESARRGLARALATMPEALAAYKRIEGIRAGLVALLR